MAYIEFQLPLQGLSEGLSVTSEQGMTSGYMSNCRPRDVLEKRIRIGQRPGLKKAYSQQIGGAAEPIIWLGSVTTVD
jgi:hypothetical protein